MNEKYESDIIRSKQNERNLERNKVDTRGKKVPENNKQKPRS